MRLSNLLSISISIIFFLLPTHSDAKSLKGKVKIDGSSTVFPITEAVAEEFGKVHPRVRVTVGVSGTGGGFKKFLANETDVNDASRRIKGKEKKLASTNKINYLELPIAYDGISVVINPKNTWAKTMTTAELKKVWQPGSTVKNWSDIRKGWPNKPIRLYGPGTDSGTFDYFTKAINGKSHVSRSDFTMSEDDNVIVQGVAGDEGSLGYFGYAYYKSNESRLHAVGIKDGKGPAVFPSHKTINNGSYKPLSRPIFIYINTKSLIKDEVYAFVKFYLEHAATLSSEVGYVALPKNIYSKNIKEIENARKAELDSK